MIIALFICFLGSAMFSGKLPEYRFPAGPGAATGVPNRDLNSRYHFTNIFEAIIRFWNVHFAGKQTRTRQFTGILGQTDIPAIYRKNCRTEEADE